MPTDCPDLHVESLYYKPPRCIVEDDVFAGIASLHDDRCSSVFVDFLGREQEDTGYVCVIPLSRLL